MELILAEDSTKPKTGQIPGKPDASGNTADVVDISPGMSQRKSLAERIRAVLQQCGEEGVDLNELAD